jgi:hypothetical protein
MALQHQLGLLSERRTRFAFTCPVNHGLSGTAFESIGLAHEDMVLRLVMVKLRLTQDDHDPIESGYQFNLIAAIISVIVLLLWIFIVSVLYQIVVSHFNMNSIQ